MPKTVEGICRQGSRAKGPIDFFTKTSFLNGRLAGIIERILKFPPLFNYELMDHRLLVFGFLALHEDLIHLKWGSSK